MIEGWDNMSFTIVGFTKKTKARNIRVHKSRDQHLGVPGFWGARSIGFADLNSCDVAAVHIAL